MTKEIVEPILASTLPGPLKNLRFTKLDFGTEPLRVGAVDVHKTTTGGIKLDMNITWESKSDIELDGSMVPKIVSCLHLIHRN
jgi:Ca2+-dependent lipid-binding protein